MTEKQYGRWMGTIMSAFPGGMGVWGMLVGLQQRRIGPLILGALFIWAAVTICRIFLKASQKRP